MEKVIAALWAGPDQDREGFNARLRAELPVALTAAGATRIRLNLRDADVDPAAALVQRWQAPQQDAIVQFWLPSANAIFRGPADAVLSAHCHRFAAWLVAESTIIPNTAYVPAAGTRTWGWSQASFISFRLDLPRQDAIAVWHSHHTRVAIDTQSNFEYVQNLVVRPLTDDAPGYDAFVEECFPAAAMTNPQAFYDAVGNDAKFQANLATMMDSCGRFIDFSRIDIIPTSQFDC
ncbi:EthD domain-containing protein [Novosphingobium sp. B 225]|uniref:EthD domain-containing protein n=1 Tax=Novosphingobium sp. B 225 TaxID=1961849 RepID=UPI000B4AAD55|nr:EthD domain-containing protein [Novosphingobium sp. B 225]